MKNTVTGYLETILKAIRDDIVKKPRFNTDTLMRLDRLKLSYFMGLGVQWCIQSFANLKLRLEKVFSISVWKFNFFWALSGTFPQTLRGMSEVSTSTTYSNFRQPSPTAAY